MRKQKKEQQPDSDLHRRAEEQLRAKEIELHTDMPEDKVRELTFELQVHQIELEMQNEELKCANIEAERLREQYQDLYDYAPVGYFTFDKKGTILSVNLTGSNLLGVEKDSLIDRRFQLYLDISSRSNFSESIKEIISTGEKRSLEVQLSGDTPVHLQVDGIAVDCEGGNRVCRAAVTDITGRLEAAKALSDSKERYRLLFDSINEGFYLADIIYDNDGVPCDYKFVEVNPAYEQMMNLKRDQMIGKSANELFPDRSSHWLEIFREVALTGTPVIDNFYSEPFNRYFGVYAFSPAKNQFAAVIKDITARRLAEEALEESENRYRHLFDSMTEGFALHEIICDENNIPIDYRFLDINPAFEQLTGLKRKDVINTTYKSLLPDDNPAWLQAYGEVALTGKSVHFDNYSPTLSRHYEVFAYSPAPRQFAVIFTDITERKQAEQALEKYRILSNYSRDIMLFMKLNGQIIEANDAAVSAYGYSHDELLTLSIFDLRSFNSPEQITAQIAEAYSDGILFETIHHRKDGSCFPVEVSSRGADINGERVLLSVVRDISLRKQAEEEIASQQHLQQLLLDHFPGVAVLLRTTTREVVAANQAGIDVGAVCGSKCFETWGQSPDPCPWCLAENLWTTGKEQSVVIEAGGKAFEAHWAPVTDDLYMHYAFDITEHKRAEEKLRDKDQLIQQTLSISNSFTFDWDLDADQVNRSVSCESIFGADAAEMCSATSRRFSEFVHPDDRQRLETLLNSPTPGAATYTTDYRVVINDERVITLEETGQAFFDADGKIKRIIGVATDITERKQTEEALRESEKKYRELIQNANSAIIRWNNNSIITFFNEYAQQLFGYTLEEIIGQNVNILIPDTESTGANLTKLAAGILQDPYQYANNENENILRDGSRIWMSWTNRPIVDESGQIVEILAIGNDITERKKAEEERERFIAIQEEYAANLKAMFIAIQDMVVIYDNNMNIQIVNPIFISTFGFNPVGMSIQDIIRLTNCRWLNGKPIVLEDQPTPDLMKNQSGQGHSFLVTGLNGKEMVLETSSAPLLINGNVQGAVSVLHDITQRIETEKELRELVQRLDSHMQNSPLAIIEWDPDYRIIRWSDEAERVFGWNANEMMGKRIDDIKWVYEEDWPIVTQLMEDMNAGIRPRNVNPNRNYRKDGSVIYCEWYNSVLRDPSGNMTSVLSLILDVTEREQAEKALKESEEKYHSLFDTLLEGFCIIEMVFDDNNKPADYRFLEINPAFEEQTGLHEAQGKLMRDLAPDHEDHWFDFYGDIALTGKPMRFVNEARALNRWFDVSAYKIGGKESRKVAILFSDITEQKQFEEALKESNDRLAFLSEAANRILTAEDPQQVIQKLCQDIMLKLDCHAFFNYLVDQDKDCLHLNAYAGIPEDVGSKIEWLDYGTAVCGCAARDKCKIIAENILETPDPRTELVKSFGIQAYACHPLLGHDGNVIGTLSFGTRSRTSFDEDELMLMKTVTDQVATTMERARLHNESERRAAELESFISNLADGVSRIDSEGHVVWMNDMGKEILCVPSEETFTDWISRYRLLTLEDTPLASEQSVGMRALAGECVTDFRYKAVTPNGDTIILSASASPVYDDQRHIIGATSTFRDQSERVSFENEKQRIIDREKHISDVLQHAILPPDVPSELMGYEIAVKYLPALDEAEIGGDFYDVFDLADGRFAVLIGDVVGKGLKAAMRVSAARHAIRSYAYLDPRPSRVLTLANNALYKDAGEESQLLTLFYAVIDPELGGIFYASAGHIPPILCNENSICDELESQGLPIGIFPDYEYEQSSHRLDPGDLVVMVTDGITEAKAAGSILLYGQEGLLDYVKLNRSKLPDELADGIVDAALRHAGGRLHDDAAVVVLAAGQRKADR